MTKEVADSLFFLNDSIGWMATENGIWTTSESGRSWKRISNLKNLRQVFFVNPTHGFAAGDGDRILQTDDGGVTWLPIRWAGTPPKSMAVVYRVIVFADARNGIVAGEVPSSDEDPDVPIRLLRPRKQIDAFAYTHDGGATWRRSINSRYGEMTRSSMGPDGIGLALLQYPQSYTWPSEIFTLDLNDDVANHLLYRSHDHAITDVLLNPGGDSYAAGYQPPGDIHPSPIPGKVRVLRSRDLKVWEEMAVDYRAVARQVWLASPTAASVWLATDTGMILKLNTP